MRHGYSHGIWWIIQSTSANALRAGFSPLGSPDGPPQPGVRPIQLLLPTLSPTTPRHDTATAPGFIGLKWKSVARGRRAPRKPSIFGWFSLLPWLVSVAGSVAPEDCPLALVAARALLAERHADATSVIVGAPPLQMC